MCTLILAGVHLFVGQGMPDSALSEQAVGGILLCGFAHRPPAVDLPPSQGAAGSFQGSRRQSHLQGHQRRLPQVPGLADRLRRHDHRHCLPCANPVQLCLHLHPDSAGWHRTYHRREDVSTDPLVPISARLSPVC